MSGRGDIHVHGDAYTRARAVAKAQQVSATNYVLRRVRDEQDARLLLDVLGLSPEEGR